MVNLDLSGALRLRQVPVAVIALVAAASSVAAGCRNDGVVIATQRGSGGMTVGTDAGASGGEAAGGDASVGALGGAAGGEGSDARIDATVGADASDPDAGDAGAEVGRAGLNWVGLPASLGAAITSIAVNTDGTLYAGTIDGISVSGGGPGIFRSTDSGDSWQAMNVGLPSFQIGSLFATGSTVIAGSLNLLRSTDPGSPWQQLAPPAGALEPIVAIDGQGPLVVAVPGFGGRGIYVSSDTGASFTQLSIEGTGVAVAGTAILLASQNRLMRSTDFGVTFNPIQAFINTTSPSSRVACDHVSTCYASVSGMAVLKSTDDGATWSILSGSGSLLAVGDLGALYINTIFSNSNGIAVVMSRSDDGGATFTNIVSPTSAGASQDCGGPYIARGDQLYVGCWNGVYRSVDKGMHWQAANGSPTAGAIMSAVYRLFVDRTPTSLVPSGDLYAVIADPSGSGSALVRSIDGGWTWQPSLKAIASSCVFPAGAIECVVNYATSDMPSLVRSNDHGVTWSMVTLPAFAPQTRPLVAGKESVVYLGGENVAFARSDDGGVTFQRLAAPTVTAMQVLENGHVLAIGPGSGTPAATYRSVDRGVTWQALPTYFSVPAVEDASGRLIQAGYLDHISVSNDEGSTWTDVATVGLHDPLGYLEFSGPMGIDGTGRLYGVLRLAYPGEFFNPLAAYGSLDGGPTWAPTPLPNANVNSFSTDKQGRLLAATAGGLFRLESADNPGPAPPAMP